MEAGEVVTGVLGSVAVFAAGALLVLAAYDVVGVLRDRWRRRRLREQRREG